MSVDATYAPPRAARTGYRHSRPRRRLPLWIAVVLWIVVAALGVVAALRLFAWDSSDLLAILNSVTAFIYLPAWIVVVVAALGRRYVLAAAALVIVVIQVVLVLPELTAAQPVPAWATTAPSLKLFDANVYVSNPSMAGYAEEIKAYQPQLLTMEEASPPDVTQLQASGALAGLPYTVQIRRYDPHAFFIASRYPLTHVSASYLFNAPLIMKMTLQLPTGPRAVVGGPHHGSGPRSVLHLEGPGGRHRPAGAPTWPGRAAPRR